MILVNMGSFVGLYLSYKNKSSKATEYVVLIIMRFEFLKNRKYIVSGGFFKSSLHLKQADIIQLLPTNRTRGFVKLYLILGNYTLF